MCADLNFDQASVLSWAAVKAEIIIGRRAKNKRLLSAHPKWDIPIKPPPPRLVECHGQGHRKNVGAGEWRGAFIKCCLLDMAVALLNSQ